MELVGMVTVSIGIPSREGHFFAGEVMLRWNVEFA